MSENQKRIDCLRTLILMSFVLAPIIVSGCASSGRGPTPLMRGTVTPLPLEPSVIGPIRQDLFHEVAPMETLWRIGQIYEVDEESIQAANHLGTSTKLEIGQTLLIPNAKPARPVIPLYNTRDWSYIVVHHSGTEKGNATSIHASHRQRGFGNGLGYHFLIDNGTMGKPLGQIEVGPRWVKQMNGAHANAAGMNVQGIGVSLVGNFSEKQVPKEQLEALVFLVNTLRKHYGIPVDRIIRHGDVPGKNTECPGLHFPWGHFKQRLLSVS